MKQRVWGLMPRFDTKEEVEAFIFSCCRLRADSLRSSAVVHDFCFLNEKELIHFSLTAVIEREKEIPNRSGI